MAERRAEENKQLGAILNADQMKRYNQLRLQRTGMTALAEMEVATELNLTAEQKTKVQEIIRAANDERRSLFQDGGGGELGNGEHGAGPLRGESHATSGLEVPPSEDPDPR